MAFRSPIRLRGEGASADTASAVVLVRMNANQFHLGLRHGPPPGELVLHLGWHRDLRDQPLAELTRRKQKPLPAAVVTLSLDPLIDGALQFFAMRVGELHADALLYGFGEPDAIFDKTTAELTDPDAAFTCATFVLAMLASLGVHLVDATRWRTPTAADEAWQETIGKALLAHIEAYFPGDLLCAKERVERNKGSRRYRPTDVAGAALLPRDKRPAGAEDVEPLAQKLECVLSGLAAAS